MSVSVFIISKVREHPEIDQNSKLLLKCIVGYENQSEAFMIFKTGL